MMISSILTYNSEIWGVYVQPDFKSWDSSQIEKTHLQFCKRYLEVSNKASNMACRAELGRFPLNIAINQKIINYFLYLRNNGNDSVVKQIFLMSADLHSSGKSSFYSSVMRMSAYYNLPDFDPNVLNKFKSKKFNKPNATEIYPTLATYYSTLEETRIFLTLLKTNTHLLVI